MPEKLISVVIPAYNAAETIGGCLDALCRQTLAADCYEVIVVDDGSSDATVEIARAYPVHVLAIAHAGPAVARNAGAAVATGDLLVFVDADCEPAPDFLERLTAPCSNPAIAGVKGAYRTRQRALMARFVQAEFEHRYARMRRCPTIDFVDTYAAAYRRSVFERYGGFDERFRGGPTVEDVEFSFRLATAGERLVFEPRAVVYHRHAADVLAYLRKKFRYGVWRVHVYRRYPGKLARDSYTPPELPIQIALAGLLALATAGSMITSLWRLVGILALLFFLTTVPFCWQTWACDRSVALVAPLLLFARSLAQAAGLVVGIVTLPWLGRTGARAAAPAPSRRGSAEERPSH